MVQGKTVAIKAMSRQKMKKKKKTEREIYGPKNIQ